MEKICPMQQAREWQALLAAGMTRREIVARIGVKQEWRVDERLSLLKLRPNFQAMLERKDLSPSQAYEMSRLSPVGQDRLFALIKAGRCQTYAALRASVSGIAETECRGAPQRRAMTKAEESAIDRIDGALDHVRSALADAGLPLAANVQPDLACTLADKLFVVRRVMDAFEKALRKVAAQGEMAA